MTIKLQISDGESFCFLGVAELRNECAIIWFYQSPRWSPNSGGLVLMQSLMGETTPVAHGGNPQDRTGSPRPRCIA
ncbi:hypothetical protein [Moorena sp. SIO4G3]|uniref:hypothetical protein n=1 Tax=Moorena sp. SIO4G3 TaxID=2607821 RepID=UPI00142952F5|nr:hypothetical protein [Moorena sp. SIO4G3]NEO76566.1 hypothetical protein [Moorena sp. SIO4G3]